MTLTNKEKQTLKAKAHHLDPQIQIGKQGLTPEQIQTIKTHLQSHELLKIKFNDHKHQKEELSKQITTETESEQISLIGNTLIIYKKHTQ
ncbi:MAG: YhbY family RNA-binding protein [Candidatus Bathyarchaeota archaeon]|nr:YhbY family RNA-binding protein [Candidatus Bathyarchaeota archaeon]